MLDHEILKLEKTVITTERYLSIKIRVYQVQKCNFNDERLIDDLELNLLSLVNKPLYWFDPYLGKNKKSNISIAVAYVSKDEVCLLEKIDDKITIYRTQPVLPYYLTEEYNDRMFLAAHVEVTF